MTTSTSDPGPADQKAAIRKAAAAQGFEACGFASVLAPWVAGERLLQFIGEGCHGTMAWMEETAQRRSHPRAMWPDAASAIVLGMNYGPDHDPLDALKDRRRAAI